MITGASAGIGEQMARRLAELGHAVTLVARRQDRLRELADELRQRHGVRADAHACDLADAKARGALIAQLQGGSLFVAGLCNNAGFGTFGRFADLDHAREAEEVALNVSALHELTGAFLGAMVERDEGAVLNTGSLAGFQPQPGNATYAATKAFVNSFSEALHAELSGSGVSCTVLCPGPVKTEFADVAGVGHLDGVGGRLLWASAAEAARAGIDGMLKGKRTVMPRAADHLLAQAGRYAPRTLLLPMARRAVLRGLGQK